MTFALAVASALVIGTVFGFVLANLLEGASRRAAEDDAYARWRAGGFPWNGDEPRTISEVVHRERRR